MGQVGLTLQNRAHLHDPKEAFALPPDEQARWPGLDYQFWDVGHAQITLDGLEHRIT